MTASDSFTFSVKYQLGEYLAVVRAHARSVRAEAGKPAHVARVLDEVVIATFGTAMFFLKSRRVGVCTFTLSSDGVARSSKGGTFTVPWPHIKAVRKYESSYLIDTGDGAMPIPFRVLSADQRSAIETWGLVLVGQAAAG